MNCRPPLPVLLVVLAASSAALVSPAAAARFAKVGSFNGHWQRMMRDARSEALGGSQFALADGPFASMENAAPGPGRDGIEIGATEFDLPYAGMGWRQMGLAANWKRLRLGLVGARYLTDDMLVRTAYQPEGTGETIDVEESFLICNLAYDLPIFESPVWDWAVGAAWRRHTFSIDENEWRGWDTDLGLTGRWRRSRGDDPLAVTGSVLLRNFLEQDVEYEERRAELPRFRNLGLAVSWAHDLLGTERHDLVLKVGVATIRDFSSGDQGFFGDLRSGVELGLFDLVSLRFGADERRTYADEQSWGAGVSLPSWYSQRWIARYDFVQLGEDDNGIYDNTARHSFTTGVRF